MENNNTNESQKLMENYNFDSPIQVTLVLEEEDKPNSFIIYYNDSSETTNIPTNDVGDKLNQSQTKEIPIPVVERAYNKKPQQKKYFKRLPPTKNNSSLGDTNGLEEKFQGKSSDFKWHLLNPVIDNLINISKFHYHNILGVNKQRPDLEKLKSEYLTFKHHFFNLSYSTTVALLLPEENNENFLLKFVERIIQIANKFSWNEISFERTYTLIRDLLCWTKRKKSYIENKFSSPNCAADIFASSITSRLPHVNPNQTTQPLNISPLANNSNTPITNNLQQQSTQPFRLQSFQPIQGNNLFPNYGQPTTSTINSPRQIPNVRQPTTRTVNSPRQIPNILQPTTSAVYDTSQIPNVRPATTRTVNNTTQIGIDPSVHNILNYQNATQTMYPTSDPAEYENYATRPYKRKKTNDNYDLEECNTYVVQTSKDPVRSCISRDSGFGSPSYANFPDVDLNPIINQEEMFPIISHVTSTNPNAVNIQKGNCKVCQAATNKMCIGCYDQYYCSSVCQELDWSSHQTFCKNK